MSLAPLKTQFPRATHPPGQAPPNPPTSGRPAASLRNRSVGLLWRQGRNGARPRSATYGQPTAWRSFTPASQFPEGPRLRQAKGKTFSSRTVEAWSRSFVAIAGCVTSSGRPYGAGARPGFFIGGHEPRRANPAAFATSSSSANVGWSHSYKPFCPKLNAKSRRPPRRLPFLLALKMPPRSVVARPATLKVSPTHPQ